MQPTVKTQSADEVRSLEGHLISINGDGDSFSLVCSECGDFASATDVETARLLRRLHDRAVELSHKAADR